MQLEGTPVQTKPSSMVQSEQPSPAVGLPSSHSSVTITCPSPQPGGGPPSTPPSGTTFLPSSIENWLQPLGCAVNDWLAIASASLMPPAARYAVTVSASSKEPALFTSPSSTASEVEPSSSWPATSNVFSYELPSIDRTTPIEPTSWARTSEPRISSSSKAGSVSVHSSLQPCSARAK